jgi:hypothetical protein
MELLASNPIEHEGKVYDRLAANLALSQILQPDGIRVSIAVRLTPYRVGPEGIEALEDAVLPVVFGDALEAAQSDQALAQFLEALKDAAETYINLKGL